jgi:hypothetical protein
MMSSVPVTTPRDRLAVVESQLRAIDRELASIEKLPLTPPRRIALIAIRRALSLALDAFLYTDWEPS